ncbi:MAG: PAS domain-containing protein, partial [Anaerolineae bacterium]|nr:PAS domain-containing protein [Anaerolineae bacterium]
MAYTLPPHLEQDLARLAARRNESLEAALAWLIGSATKLDTGEHLAVRLRQHERDFKTLVENNPDFIARLDRDLRHIYVNPALERVTGLSLEQHIGKTVHEVGFPADVADYLEGELRSVIETRVEKWARFAYRTPVGVRSMESRLTPEFDDDGQVQTIMTITRDITEQKQAEAALRASEEQYRALVESQLDLICRYT